MGRRLGIAAALVALATVALYIAAASVLGSDAVRAEIERQLASRLGQPVHIGSASAAIFPRVAVDLQDVSIGSPAAVHLAHLRVATGLRALFSRTVADAEVVASDGRLTLPLPFDLAPAGGGGAAPASAALTIASIRVISLRNIVLTAGGESLQVDLDSSLAGDRLDVPSIVARAAHTRVTGRGAFSDLTRLEGRFDVVADPLDLDEMTRIGAALTGASPRSAPPGAASRGMLHLAIGLKAPAARFAGFNVRDLSAAADVVPGRFSFSPFSVRLAGGTVSGAIHVTTAAAAPRLQTDARLTGLDLAQLATGGGITGTLTGTARLSAEGADAERIFRSARGTLNASLADGVLPHLDMVRSIVLAFGKPSGVPPAGSGTAFSRAGGDFTLAGGVLTSQNLSLASRDLDMAGRGALSATAGTVDASVDVVLSPELTAQAGTDLRRYAQQDGRVVVPAIVTGPLTNPSVTIDVVAAGRRAIGNELQRRLSDAIGGLFKKKKGGGG